MKWRSREVKNTRRAKANDYFNKLPCCDVKVGSRNANVTKKGHTEGLAEVKRKKKTKPGKSPNSR